MAEENIPVEGHPQLSLVKGNGKWYVEGLFEHKGPFDTKREAKKAAKRLADDADDDALVDDFF